MSGLFDRLARVFEAGHAREVELLVDAMAPPEELRPAAVLIAVTDRPEPGVILIHRPETMRSHAGQAAFPGGKIDPGEDAISAALREAHEELGIDPQDVRVIGVTDPFRTRTGYDVTPVLGVIPPDLPLIPNPHEVASWFEPPLAYVLNPANRTSRTADWGGGKRTYFEIVWQQHRIWGITAAIIGNLAMRMALDELTDG